jgi:hypothetical protein
MWPTIIVQGHLTNAALWGPEQHQQHSSTSSGSSSSSSSTLPDPSQQPVWSLQQLFELLGQQQAGAVWQQIVDTAGGATAGNTLAASHWHETVYTANH